MPRKKVGWAWPAQPFLGESSAKTLRVSLEMDHPFCVVETRRVSEQLIFRTFINWGVLCLEKRGDINLIYDNYDL
jgi:hypothetical protein